MTRRSQLTSRQRIDLAQRRRTRGNDMYSEQPTPLNVQRLPGGGAGNWDPAWPTDSSWLSPATSWMDPGMGWL
jgi:hypothetical protein